MNLNEYSITKNLKYVRFYSFLILYKPQTKLNLYIKIKHL